jgi:23S rRNA pseudouridine2457 synthase
MNRQVRKMCAAVGLPCLRLVRAAIGPLGLGDLRPGQWRDLTAAEVAELQQISTAARLGNPSGPARGRDPKSASAQLPRRGGIRRGH